VAKEGHKAQCAFARIFLQVADYALEITQTAKGIFAMNSLSDSSSTVKDQRCSSHTNNLHVIQCLNSSQVKELQQEAR
jgi:hypothetical protein